VSAHSESFRKSSQSRLLCFVVTAIAKLATHHRELLPRARVSLGKVCLSVLTIICNNICQTCVAKVLYCIFNAAIVLYQLTHVDLDIHVKVARSRISDARVWRRARDYLGLMNEPAICLSVLGPSRPSCGQAQNPGTVNWSEGRTKMIAHVPFYILGEHEGQDIAYKTCKKNVILCTMHNLLMHSAIPM
jgi:AP-5 complex subunit zeta-1